MGPRAVCREALQLARILLSKPHFNGVLCLSAPRRLLGRDQGTAAKEARSGTGTAPEEVPVACARWSEEHCQSG